MLKKSRIAIGLLTLAVVLAGARPATPAQTAKSTVEQIRKQLLQLPYYGVFDFLAFTYENGTVTLTGYAYRPSLKQDAERGVKRAAGVDEVKNQIEVLPVSPNDDDTRWRAYWVIYGDPFLSRYAPGGGTLWGHRHPLARVGSLHPLSSARFLGMEPAGDYPIHLIVKNGKITLLGVVDSAADKNLAGLRAREVPLTFGVENELVVENEQTSTKR